MLSLQCLAVRVNELADIADGDLARPRMRSAAFLPVIVNGAFAALLVARSAVEGIQPVFRQSPHILLCAIKKVSALICTNPSATGSLPVPPPITQTSILITSAHSEIFSSLYYA